MIVGSIKGSLRVCGHKFKVRSVCAEVSVFLLLESAGTEQGGNRIKPGLDFDSKCNKQREGPKELKMYPWDMGNEGIKGMGDSLKC